MEIIGVMVVQIKENIGKDTSKMIGHYAKIVIINMAEENNYG